MSILREIKELFGIFYAYTGARMYIVFALTMLAALVESVGITMLLPLIQILDTGGFGGDVDGRLNQTLFSILEFLNIDESAVRLLLFIGLIFCFKAIVKFTQGAYSTILATDLRREMISKLYGMYGSMQYSYYASHNTGHFINVLIGQVYRLTGAFFTFKGFLAKIVQTVLYLTFATLISWKFALMALVAGIAYILVFSRLNLYVKKVSRLTAEESSNLNKKLVQNLQGYKYLLATSGVGKLSGSVMDAVYRLTGYSRKLGLLGTFVSALKEPLSILLILFIIIIQVGVLQEPVAPILVSLILVHRAMGQMMNLQGAWLSTLGKTGAIEMVEKEMKAVHEAQEPDGTQELDSFREGISFEHVSFWYDGEAEQEMVSPTQEEEAADRNISDTRSGLAPVVNDISLFIPARHTVAFTGPSGAGKTSLLDVIMLLLRPQKGLIRIDGIDATQLNSSSWRQQIGFVAQDTVVFDDTLANNICLWEGDYNKDKKLEQDIRDALEKAYLKEFVEGLPEGLDTIVGERGVKLSGGQKQRLFIARELFKQPSVLILDEATSALDQESERYIQQSIEALKGSMTVIIVAHRLSTIQNADQIYVLDHGRIAESGSYEELLKRNGRLAALAGSSLN